MSHKHHKGITRICQRSGLVLFAKTAYHEQAFLGGPLTSKDIISCPRVPHPSKASWYTVNRTYRQARPLSPAWLHLTTSLECLSRVSFSFLLSRFSPPMGTSLIHGDVIRYIDGSVNRCKIVGQFVRPARTVQAGHPECPPMALTCPRKHDGGYARVNAWVEASI